MQFLMYYFKIQKCAFNSQACIQWATTFPGSRKVKAFLIMSPTPVSLQCKAMESGSCIHFPTKAKKTNLGSKFFD